MDIFETEAFKTYNNKFMAFVEAIENQADDVVIKELEYEASVLKLALVEAEAKRNNYAP